MNITLQRLAALLVVVLASRAPGSIHFADSFASGLNPNWWTVQHIYLLSQSPVPLFSIDTSHQDVRVKSLAGSNGAYHAVRIFFTPQVTGDFDMKLDFRDANLAITNGWGACANQIALHAKFGGTDFATTRDIAVVEGNNFHVYTNPPGQTFGVTPTTALAGTLEVKRVGNLYSGYFNGQKVYENTFSNTGSPQLWFSLENNQTADISSVTFDNFSIVADNIVGVPNNGAAVPVTGGLGSGIMVGAWVLLRHRLRRKNDLRANTACPHQGHPISTD